MDNFIFTQILGIITLIIFVASLQQRKKENYLLLQTFGTILFIIQYLLTNKITGAITFSIVLVRGLVFYYYKKKDLKPSPKLLIIFQTALLISTYLTWQNILSIVPFIATSIKTWGTWQDDMKWIRKTSLISQGSMIIYNLSASMYTGALTELCNLASTVIAIWRYDFNADDFITERGSGMDFLELSQSRRSIRGFMDKAVSQEDVQKLMKAAQSAPSAGNCQPWRFFIIRDKAIQADIAGKACRQPFILTAPVMIVVCADMPKSEKRYGGRGRTLYCIQDTAAAIQNILLCARSLGLGTCWCGAFDEKAVADILRLPEEQRPVAIIPVGYPANEPSVPTSRKPLEDIVTYIGESYECL